MAKVVPLDQALKFWVASIGSALLLYYGSTLIDFLIGDPTSGAAVRWLGVFVAAVMILPWIVLVAWGVSMADEYHIRVALVGTAVAFVLDLMAHNAFNVMLDARLVSHTSYIPELIVAAACWVLGVAGASIYYRFRL